MHAHSVLGLGSVISIPNDRQPKDCTWDSLFNGLPPVRPDGVGEGTQFKLGESVISRSGDTCSEGSWVFYNTHNVCQIVTIPKFTPAYQPKSRLRSNPLQTPRASIKSLRAERTSQDHSSFSSHGMCLHGEMSITGCPRCIVIPKVPTLPCCQRSASAVVSCQVI